MQTSEAVLLRTEGKLCGIDSANAPRRHSAVSLRARVTQADDAGIAATGFAPGRVEWLKC